MQNNRRNYSNEEKDDAAIQVFSCGAAYTPELYLQVMLVFFLCFFCLFLLRFEK